MKNNINNKNTSHFSVSNSNMSNENSGHCTSGNNNIDNFNFGNYNSGYFNTGNNNIGDCNTGNFNIGDHNAGSFNVGNFNTGDRNAGNNNTGCFNAGVCNAGYANMGSFNIGMFNICNNSNGIFCTKEPTIKIFDVDTNMTMTEFRKSIYFHALISSRFNLTRWAEYSEDERAMDNAKNRLGGRMIKVDFKTACAEWWSNLKNINREIIQTMPNFNKTKFKLITGIELQ